MATNFPSQESLKTAARSLASKYLRQNNVTSIGIGFKDKDGEKTDEVCFQFTVGRKVAPESLAEMQEIELPKQIDVDGFQIATDVVERKFGPSTYSETGIDKGIRKRRIDPIFPGASIGHPKISAGTAGCVVYDNLSGEEYLLSNWHVLHGEAGKIGDVILQPGAFDDNRISANKAGTLVRSHIGLAGDCAIARITDRNLEDEIFETNTAVDSLADPKLGDKVFKSGRTTGLTYGIVNRIHVTTKINYGQLGEIRIGCFEYIPDPDQLPDDGEISMGGDSGSAVVLREGNRFTTILLGIHFAGEIGDNREHALACYSSSVFKKLEISPRPISEIERSRRNGYNPHFLSIRCRQPLPFGDMWSKLLEHKNEQVFDYTHFSLTLHKERKFAAWIAWNIDGASLKRLSRSGIRFRKDPNLPADAQIGNELYVDNPLDRGHIARRADLNWGPIHEAKQANIDSFYFTNMAPQHERFNQSAKAGIWGNLENAIYDGLNIQNLRVSVFSGPIYDDNDPVYRGIQIPVEFWKIVIYVEENTSKLSHHAYILTQRDLVRNLERLDLSEFEIYEVDLTEISDLTGFEFPDLRPGEAESESIKMPRKINSSLEIIPPLDGMESI